MSQSVHHDMHHAPYCTIVPATREIFGRTFRAEVTGSMVHHGVMVQMKTPDERPGRAA